MKSLNDLSLVDFGDKFLLKGPPLKEDGSFYAYCCSIPGTRKRRNKIDELTLVRSMFSIQRLMNLVKRYNYQLFMCESAEELSEARVRLGYGQRFKKLNDDSITSVVGLEHFRLPPYKHQIKGIAFSVYCTDSAYLAFDMGTGKTVCGVGLANQLDAKRILVACPKSVIQVWQEELETNFPNYKCRIAALDSGSAKKKAEVAMLFLSLGMSSDQPVWVICNYESLISPAMEKVITSQSWHLVIADEAHKLKSAKSKRSKLFAKLTTRSKYRLLLSGTPLPNNKLDSFGQFRFMDPGIFGTNFSAFQARYAQLGGYGNYQVIGWQNEEEFNKLISLKMMRVDIDDVIDLPESVTRHVYCDMGPKAIQIYKQLKTDFAAYLSSGEVTTTNTLSRLMKFRQLASGFVINDDGETIEFDVNKADVLEEILDDIYPEEKVVIFCDFKRDIAKIKDVVRRVRKQEAGEVSGSVKDTEGGKFPPWTNTLVCQAQAGGLGLNLADARHCIFYSVSYNLADYEQAKARVYRSGQKRSVVYTHIVCNNGVDKAIYKALSNKADVVEQVMLYVRKGGLRD